MSVNDDACLVLPAASIDALQQSPLGNLKAVLTREQDQAALTFHDTFDQQFRGDHTLMIGYDDRIDLWLPQGAVLSQPVESPNGLTTAAAGLLGVQVGELRGLTKLGGGRGQRSELALIDGEGKTRVRASVQTLEVEGADRVALVTLHKMRGYDKAAARLRSTLIAQGGMALAQVDLHARLFPERPPFLGKPKVPIRPDEPVFDVATRIITAHLPVVRQYEAGAIADIDPEFLHGYRVALRKIRSVVSLFKGVFSNDRTSEFKTRFAALMKPTGPVRDLDVSLMERRHFEQRLPESLHGGLDRLFAIFAEERGVAQKRLAQHLRSKAYRQEMADLEDLFRGRSRIARGPDADRLTHDLACRLIWKRYRKIGRIAQTLNADTPDHEVHELRIHGKKLRYLMEFFAPLFPDDRIRRLIKPLKRLQDNLGLYNDYSVQQSKLQQVLVMHEQDRSGPNVELAQSVGALIAVLHQRQAEERARVMGNLAHFQAKQTRQAFRDLFHAGKERG
ncbi:CHAD domain-containing protein [Paracoccus sp. (in: a-proteobacteria)]|uniref:CHAD domain-containing protein n=1 Tax=Paracoccus sp. TaxID=267 RepID=UPI00396CB449